MRWRLLSLITVLAAGAVAPFLVTDSILRFAINTLVMATIAVSWSILARAGQESLGHAAFFGLGAYVAALLTADGGASIGLAIGVIVVGGVVALGLALVLSTPLLRVQGAYFALAMLAVAEIFHRVALRLEFIGGQAGLLVAGIDSPLPTYHIEFYIIFFVTLLAVIISWRLKNTTFELATAALRDNITTATAVGISRVKYQRYALLISGFLTGLSGAFFVYLNQYAQPNIMFGIEFSLDPLVFALFGGFYSVVGPVIGAVLVRALDFYVFSPLLGSGSIMLYGGILIVAVLYFPRGITPLIDRGVARLRTRLEERGERHSPEEEQT